MAPTFHVLPERPASLALEALAERATSSLRAYVAGLSLERLIDLPKPLLAEARAVLERQAERVGLTLGGVGAPAEAWGGEADVVAIAFSVQPGGGGGKARRGSLGDPASAALVELARASAAERGRAAELERCLASGICFSVERSFGQPPLATLAHAFLAAAVAEATGGLVLGVDGAWDEGAFPCTGAELQADFMRPERAVEAGRRRAEAMLREVALALAPFDGRLVARVLDAVVSGLVGEVNSVRGDPERELAAFDHALDRLDTVRLFAAESPVRERDVLLGGVPDPRVGAASAFARLHPTPEEYERWLAHLGEHLA